MEISPIHKAREIEVLRVSESNRDRGSDKKRRGRKDRPSPGRPSVQASGYEDFSSTEIFASDDDDGVVSVLL